MSDPNDLAAFLNEGWQHLRRGVADAKSPARYPTFATVSPGGVPEARTVALRGASQREARLEVHTDTQTAKIDALRHNPLAAFHVWIPRADLQIRATGRVTIETGATVDDKWAGVPENSRVSYGTEPAPGMPIPSVHAYEKPPRRARFAVLTCDLTEIDLVHLGTPHRRARFVAADGWAGTWVAP